MIDIDVINNSLELPSLQLVQVAPEGQVFQEHQLVHQVQLVPSHQESPGEINKSVAAEVYLCKM